MVKKILYSVAVVLVVALIALYVVLFTSFGNKIVASYLQDKINTSIGLDTNLSKFELRFSSLDLVLDIANMAQFKIDGNLKLFSLGFDLNYMFSLDKEYIKKMGLNTQQNVSFGGKIYGKSSDFIVNGEGFLLGSNPSLNSRIVDYNPLELKLAANGIKIEEILDLISKPRYMSGIINVNADIKSQDLKADGKALIDIYTSGINYEGIKKDFNLTLPQGSEPKLQVEALIKDKDINAKSNLENSYLNFKTNNTKYNLANGILNTDFSFNIPNLSKISALINNKIAGNLSSDGNVTLAQNKLEEFNAKVTGQQFAILQSPAMNLVLNAKASQKGEQILYIANANSDLFNLSKLEGYYQINNGEFVVDSEIKIDDLSKFKDISGQDMQGRADINLNSKIIGSEIKSLKANADIAGGKITANSNGKTLDLKITSLDLNKALALAAQPAYASGILNATASLKIADFSKINGDFKADANGILGQKALSQMLGRNFPANSKYDMNLKGDIKNSIVNFNLVLKSDLANLNSFKGSFDIGESKLSSDFSLDAYDFSRFGFLVDKKLSGKASFNGKLDFDKNLQASINSSDLFKGKLNANLKNNVFNAKLTQIDFSSLMRGLDLPDYYEAKSDVEVDYNLLSSEGNFNANLNNGKLKKVGIINTVINLTKKDITTQAFHTSNAKAKISKNQVNLNVNMQAKQASVDISNGIVNLQNSGLNLPFTLVIDKANFKGKITGKTDNPSINLDIASSLLQSAGELLKDEKIKEKGKKEIDKLLKKLF